MIFTSLRAIKILMKASWSFCSKASFMHPAKKNAVSSQEATNKMKNNLSVFDFAKKVIDIYLQLWMVLVVQLSKLRLWRQLIRRHTFVLLLHYFRGFLRGNLLIWFSKEFSWNLLSCQCLSKWPVKVLKWFKLSCLRFGFNNVSDWNRKQCF